MKTLPPLIGQPVWLVLVLLSTICLNFNWQETVKPNPKEQQDALTSDTKSQPAKDSKPVLSLKIKRAPTLTVSLKAEKVPLPQIAQELSKRLRIPISVSSILDKELITTEFDDLSLEPAVQFLAPVVYIDFEVNTGSTSAPRPLGIFLHALNENEPPSTAVVPASTQSLLIEGNTEDGVEADTEEEKKKEEEAPLKIEFENNNLSIRARKQPLSLVISKIGEELGIPVDIKAEGTEVVDIEIKKLPVEEVIKRLSPNISVFVRADLAHAERRVLRIVLREPEG